MDFGADYSLIKKLIDNYDIEDNKALKIVMEEIVELMNQNKKIHFELLWPKDDTKSSNGVITIGIKVKLEHLKYKLNIDIGDLPNEITLQQNKTKLFLQDEEITVYSYPIEFILADKICSIFTRTNNARRIKDYYDFYLISEYMGHDIDYIVLQKAMDYSFSKNKTFKNTEITKEYFKNKLIFFRTNYKLIEKNNIFYQSYLEFKNRFEFDKELEFVTILQTIKNFIDTYSKNKNKNNIKTRKFF